MAMAGELIRAEILRQRIGELDLHQVAIWRKMSPADRLELAFQAYQFALEAVKTTEQKRHPDLSPEEFAWHVTRRMQADSTLGRS